MAIQKWWCLGGQHHISTWLHCGSTISWSPPLLQPQLPQALMLKNSKENGARSSSNWNVQWTPMPHIVMIGGPVSSVSSGGTILSDWWPRLRLNTYPFRTANLRELYFQTTYVTALVINYCNFCDQSYFIYWCISGSNISTYTAGSTLLAYGLSAQQAMVCLIHALESLELTVYLLRHVLLSGP